MSWSYGFNGADSSSWSAGGETGEDEEEGRNADDERGGPHVDGTVSKKSRGMVFL